MTGVAGARHSRPAAGNVLLQTPFAIFGIQPYVTTGVGVYREALDDRRAHGSGSIPEAA